ncbi:MAG: BrnT family toxin [Syntrophobacteraceae bacterium]|nr:BrnT family toxin [Syntrophobacteraceae bacterium]
MREDEFLHCDTLQASSGEPYILYSEEEERFVLIGQSIGGRLLVVVHMERGDRIRIISAGRQQTKRG